jgi:hypothetical protein
MMRWQLMRPLIQPGRRRDEFDDYKRDSANQTLRLGFVGPGNRVQKIHRGLWIVVAEPDTFDRR